MQSTTTVATLEIVQEYRSKGADSLEISVPFFYARVPHIGSTPVSNLIKSILHCEQIAVMGFNFVIHRGFADGKELGSETTEVLDVEDDVSRSEPVTDLHEAAEELPTPTEEVSEPEVEVPQETEVAEEETEVSEETTEEVAVEEAEETEEATPAAPVVNRVPPMRRRTK